MNYIKCKKGLIKTGFLYIDKYNEENDTLLLTDIISNEDIQVSIRGIFGHTDYKYTPVYCDVPNKYANKFIKCLDKLKDKMLLLGNTDYDEVSTSLINKLEGDYNEMKGGSND